MRNQNLNYTLSSICYTFNNKNCAYLNYLPLMVSPLRFDDSFHLDSLDSYDWSSEPFILDPKYTFKFNPQWGEDDLSFLTPDHLLPIDSGPDHFLAINSTPDEKNSEKCNKVIELLLSSSLTVRRLRKGCMAVGIATSGNRLKLIKRVSTYLIDQGYITKKKLLAKLSKRYPLLSL